MSKQRQTANSLHLQHLHRVSIELGGSLRQGCGRQLNMKSLARLRTRRLRVLLSKVIEAQPDQPKGPSAEVVVGQEPTAGRDSACSVTLVEQQHAKTAGLRTIREAKKTQSTWQAWPTEALLGGLSRRPKLIRTGTPQATLSHSSSCCLGNPWEEMLAGH